MRDANGMTVAQAVNEEGDGIVRPEPLNGQALGDQMLSEADRLAAAQAERLKRREELRTAAPATPQAEAQAAPKVVSELHVRILDSGKVEVLGPINDPTLYLDIIHQALIVLFNHTVVTVQKATEAKAKVPFMQRIFQKRARPAAPGQA